MNRYIRDLQWLTVVAVLVLAAGLVLLITAPMPAEPGSLVFGLFLVTLLALAIWFVVRAQNPQARSRMRTVCRGGLVVGGAAFAVGFFGPMLARPDSGNGPLVGICFTGPVGFVAGVVGACLWCQRRRWRREQTSSTASRR